MLVLLFGSVACSRTEATSAVDVPSMEITAPIVAEDFLLSDSIRGLSLFQGRPFSGTAVRNYPSGARASSTEYVQGKRHGKHQKWFEDGMLSFEGEYAAGRPHGTRKSWWRNGHLRSESHFVHGVADGVQMQYYKSGAKFKRIQLVNGQEQGLQQSWRENGKLYNNYEARNGRIFGLKRSKLCFQIDDGAIKQ